jgi:hypothetical protein
MPPFSGVGVQDLLNLRGNQYQRGLDAASQSGLEEALFPHRPYGGSSNRKHAGRLGWADIVRSEKSNPLVNRATC